MSIERPAFLEQRFINEAHRRFSIHAKGHHKAQEREKRRKESEPENRRRLEQSRHDRIAARSR